VGAAPPEGVTLDAGALLALARAEQVGARVTVPATALAQAIRRPSRQARLSRLVRQPMTRLVALDGPDATSVGLLLAASRTRDITDAHVVICARRFGEPIMTSDRRDLARLDPRARLIEI
jgi:predicted nucleic acid-binding protein